MWSWHTQVAEPSSNIISPDNILACRRSCAVSILIKSSQCGKSSQCHQSRFFLWRCSLHGPLQGWPKHPAPSDNEDQVPSPNAWKRTSENQLTVSWKKEHDTTREHILSAKNLSCFQCFKKYSNYNRVKRHFKTSHLMNHKCNICNICQFYMRCTCNSMLRMSIASSPETWIPRLFWHELRFNKMIFL